MIIQPLLEVLKIEISKLFGLTEYETKCYVTLLKIGISTSGGICRNSRIPYGRIYDVLFSLSEKGFIKIFEGRPKRFIAIEPRMVFNKIIDEKKKELEENEKQIKDVINKLETVSKVKIESPLEAIKIIEGRKNYLNFSVKLHEKAKKEWRAIHRLPVYKPHIDAYRKMIKKGVETKVITQITKDNLNRTKIWKEIGIKLRYVDKIDVRFTVIDKEEIVLRLSDPEIKGWIAIWVRSPSLANTLANYFDKMWEKAKIDTKYLS